jgi:hypothetical protein
MHMLAACEYWEEDVDGKRLCRRVRQPKSLMPHMAIIADDLLGAYIRGTQFNTCL